MHRTPSASPLRRCPALRVLGASLALALGACSRGSGSPPEAEDVHSHAQPARVRVRHVDLDLSLDFERRVVEGAVRLDLERTDRRAPLVLDCKGLDVARVLAADGTERPFTLTPTSPEASDGEGLGAALSVELSEGDESVRIEYRTTERSDALQWLAPEQTSGRQAPFLFTQGQAIYTRTWIPLQDSPGVRVTYSARVRAPEGLTVLMSARQLGRDADGAFRFALDQPIPPYLIALACGDLAFRPVSERCGVWAEPADLDRARAELEDMEAMVRASEEMFGPYRWGRFDVLVLPPAFPYGGMENPCLTFATPTILAGDKSLVGLIAHELAHSWSGNLVTNATWRDFWLNEGFTVYFENRIMERVFGAERARMELQLARADLLRELEELEPWQEVLHIDLAGRHPDDGFSGVPYDKGALFLHLLEATFGRPRFDAFLRRWFDEHAFESVTTARFRAFLERELLAQDRTAARNVDVDRWLSEPGLPPEAPDPRSTLLTAVDEVAARWRAAPDVEALTTGTWSTQEWLHFLAAVGPGLDAERMAALDARFALTDSGNAEILCAWLRLAVQHDYAPADDALRRFLTTVGRRKFLSPLYKELVKSDGGRARALEIYRAARGRYHAVSRGTLDEIVGWDG